MSIINVIKSLTYPAGSVAPTYTPTDVKFGWIKDTPEIDPTFEQLAPKLSYDIPIGFDIDLRKWCSPVEHQGTVGSCVANATIGAIEMRRNYVGLKHEDLSRLFAYYNSRVGHSATAVDDGTYIRMCIKSMALLGVCPESMWQYDTTMVFKRPGWNCYRAAYAYKLTSFYRIATAGEQRHNQIIAALRANHPVIFGVPVYQSFRECTGVVKLPSGIDPKLGGHAMLIVGVDIANRMYLIRNSWGEKWGDGGYARMPFPYFDICGAHDIWVCTV